MNSTLHTLHCNLDMPQPSTPPSTDTSYTPYSHSHSTDHPPHSILYTSHTPHSTHSASSILRPNLHSTLHTASARCTRYNLHSIHTQHAPQSTIHTPHSKFQTSRAIHWALRARYSKLTLYTLNTSQFRIFLTATSALHTNTPQSTTV